MPANHPADFARAAAESPVGRLHRCLPTLAILAAALLWGGSFAAMRFSLQVLSPWAMMWGRMIVALVVLLPLAGRLVPRDYRKGDWKRLLPMVLLQPCLYFYLESNALRFTTSSQAGVIAASTPLWMAVGAWLVLSETITRRVVAGLAVSVVGVAALTGLESPGGLAQDPLLGNSLELLAMACAAGSLISVKHLSRRYNPWTLTAFQVLAGTIFFLPGLGHLIRLGPDVWTPGLAMAMGFLGAFVTLGAFGLFNWGLSRTDASRAAIFINLVPVNAVIIGWGLLGERLSALQCAAGLAVVVGVWLAQGASHSTPRAAREDGQGLRDGAARVQDSGREASTGEAENGDSRPLDTGGGCGNL